MKPAFRKDGTVTAANASQISDGASALVVMSAEAAKKRGLKPLARITGYSTGGTEPKWVMYAPVVAIASGRGHSLAVRSDGSVYAWGANAAGQLGIGSSEPYRAEPVQIPGLDLD